MCDVVPYRATISLRSTVKRIPLAGVTYAKLSRGLNIARSISSPYLRTFPAGHYYSPLPDRDALSGAHGLDRSTRDVAGVELRESAQLETLDRIASFHADVPFPRDPSPGHRYHSDNVFFAIGDAIVLQAMLRLHRPRRVIEAGSGYSSGAMLDTDDRFLDGSVEFTFIDPYPQRLLSLLSSGDRARCTIRKSGVQHVDMELFSTLEENDILFIDSSHVVKVGSDVDYLLAEILPQLRVGVLVHFHDVFWPFSYPEEWFRTGTAWNESFFLRSFMQYNTAFRIEYFNSYMATVHRTKVFAKAPRCLEDPGGSLWIRRVA